MQKDRVSSSILYGLNPNTQSERILITDIVMLTLHVIKCPHHWTKSNTSSNKDWCMGVVMLFPVLFPYRTNDISTTYPAKAGCITSYSVYCTG